MRIALALGLFSMACTGKNDGDTAGLEPMITGTIAPEGEDVTGDLRGYRAVAFSQGDSFIAYISANPNANCDNIVDYLDAEMSEAYDPVDVLSGGYCNMFISIKGEYTDGMTHSWEEGDDGIDVIGPGTSLECAMGEGEFVYERRDNDDPDYYWSGRWWQGHPVTYSYAISGDGEDGYQLDIQMSRYGGGFIYEDFSNDPATGDVSGLVTAEYCSGLARTGLFQ